MDNFFAIVAFDVIKAFADEISIRVLLCAYKSLKPSMHNCTLTYIRHLTAVRITGEAHKTVNET